MIPDNFPAAKDAYDKWKRLGGAAKGNTTHRDQVWNAQNKHIDYINELAKAEYIRLNGNDTLFLPVQHINKEEYEHLAAFMWKEADGEDIYDYDNCFVTQCGKGNIRKAFQICLDTNLTGISGTSLPAEYSHDSVERTTFYLYLTQAYVELMYFKNHVKHVEIRNWLTDHKFIDLDLIPSFEDFINHVENTHLKVLAEKEASGKCENLKCTPL